MAFDLNAYRLNPSTLQLLSNALSAAQAGGAQGLAQLAQQGEGAFSQSPTGQAAQPDAQGRPATPQTPTVTPEQQKILEGANAPSPAAQAAAIREQKIVEGQNPQMAQQPGQQQPVQNSPGGMPQQQGSALGNFSQEQAAQGQQGAQTQSEKSFWDNMMGSLTGQGLQGEDLTKWRQNMSLGTALGSLGAAVGGKTIGGRMGEGVYQLGAGNLAAKNAEVREGQQNNFMQAALNAIAGRPMGTQNAATSQTQGSTMTQQPAQPSALPGSTASSLASDIVQSTANLDDVMARIRRMNGVA